jgi:hypothetical protein
MNANASSNQETRPSPATGPPFPVLPAATGTYARFGRRLVALILDSIVVSIPANIFTSILGSGLIVTGGGICIRH